jgi:putative tricarboxylic transport membrane protein
MGRDGYAALALVAASLLLYWATLGLQQHPLVPIGPGFYPRILLGLTAGLSALLGISDVVRRRRRPAREEVATRRPDYGLVLRAFVVFGAYVFLLPYLGFRIATFAFLVVMQALLEWPGGARRWIAVLAVALIATAATYAVFELYLKILLPRGRLTSF